MKSCKKLAFAIVLVCLFCGTVAYGQTKTASQTGKFDIEAIQVSQVALNDFPYISLPKGLKLLNAEPYMHESDFLFFPIDGKMEKKEGQVWRAFITNDGNMGNGWSYHYFVKSLSEAIQGLGGVKIYEGKVGTAALDRIKEEATYFGGEGSIDYWNNKALTYIVRRSDGHHVYYQLSGNSAGGQLQVLQQ